MFPPFQDISGIYKKRYPQKMWVTLCL